MDAVEDYARRWIKREVDKDPELESLSDWVRTIRSLVQGRIHKLKNCVNSRPKSVFKDPSSVTHGWFRYVPLSPSPVGQIACKHSYSWIIHKSSHYKLQMRFNQSNRSFHNEFGYKLKMSDLLQKFGVKELRDFQQESVDNLLEGKDVYLSDFYPRYQRVSLS